MVLGAMEVLGCHVLGVMDCRGYHGWSWMPRMVLGAMDCPGCHRWPWVPWPVLGAVDGPVCYGCSL